MDPMRKIVVQQNKVELLSFGDCIPDGSFERHSHFQRVVNFQNNNHLISVVQEDVGRGPFNVILQGYNLEKIHSLAKQGETLQINNSSFRLRENQKYNSRLDVKDVNEELFSENMMFLENIMLELAHEKSLYFLIDIKREKYFKSGFEKEFVKRMKGAVSLLLKGTRKDLKEAITAIQGLGFGLTPSGDDFITGLLSGLYLQEEISGLDLSEIRNFIYENASSDNLITNTFLWLAYEGRFPENFQDLISSLLCQDKKEIKINTNKMLNVGETSGADTLVGFYFAFKKEGKFWL